MEDALCCQKLLRDGNQQEFEAIGEMMAAASCWRGIVPNQPGTSNQRTEAEHSDYVDIPGHAALVRRNEPPIATGLGLMRRDDLQLARDWRLRESRLTCCLFEFRGALLAYIKPWAYYVRCSSIPYYVPCSANS